MSYFKYQGKNIHYEETGSGRPLFLLHGNTASSNMFYEIAGRYAGHHKVVLIDFLGHGKSDRLTEFPADLWFDEAMQVIGLMKTRQYGKADIIGSSGGALAAINVALEAPELVGKVIADSFEGETPLKAFTQNIEQDREASKKDENARMFYYYMNGDDWEHVVDCDTSAIRRHDSTIGKFFHKPLEGFQPDILLTGSREDEFICALETDYFERVYGEMIRKIGHGKIHLFDTGGHPAMLSNQQGFLEISHGFLEE